jgi:hypothetical protein
MAYDTWVLTNANGLDAIPPEWIHIANLPLGVGEHCAAYDAVNNRMVIFGGHLGFYETEQNEVWVLHDANGIGTPSWELLSPIGGRPAPRRDCSAIYDHASNRLVIFGGAYVASSWSEPYNDVWALTNANGLGGAPEWIQLNPAGTLPSRRYFHSALLDSVSQRMIVFGGTFYQREVDPVGTYNNDTWLLTGASGTVGSSEWIQLAPAGTLPDARQGFSAGYSPASNRMVVAMGRFTELNAPQTLLNDVWVLQNANGMPRFKLSGFFAPVHMDAWNKVTAGQSVPVKWQLRLADDSLVTDLAAVSATTSEPLACPAGALDSTDSSDTAASPGLKFDPVAEQYILVWKTNKRWANTCRRFVLKLSDGSTYTANFAFR